MTKTVKDPVHPEREATMDLLSPLTLTEIQKNNPELLEILLSAYVLDNRDEYRNSFSKLDSPVASTGLFGTPGITNTAVDEPKVKRQRIIFAIDDYIEDENFSARSEIPLDFDFLKIIPRSQKAREIQKRRVKEKAEVFTPTWVCNMQANLVDDSLIIGETVSESFNIPSSDNKTWTPTSTPVDFSDYEKKKNLGQGSGALNYICEKRLEITMGEAPYLVSPYDTVNGEYLPVKDDNGLYQRVGFLDRKIRVVNEFVDTTVRPNQPQGDKGLWESLVHDAYCCTYGYEWQGDNLLLARLNALNTYRDYYYERWSSEPTVEELTVIAVVISMNFWQMDGLKAIVPLSESDNYENNPHKKTGFYDGIVPVITFNHGSYAAKIAYGKSTVGSISNYSQYGVMWESFEKLNESWLKEKAKKKPARKGK